jgi:negative regulator of sigma-B (phosphoserine phosphatase)
VFNFTQGIIHTMLAGQSVSGDCYVAGETPRGFLACVIDGLGHGEKAYDAAARAAQTVCENLNEDPDELLRLCHRALTTTRGAVMSAALIDTTKQQVTWAGVGNVAAVILPAQGDSNKNRRHLLVHGGIVGYRMPTVRLFTEPFAPGDTLLLATDGIRSGFVDDIPRTKSPQDIATYIYDSYNRGTDDSLVLVVRYSLQTT